MKQKPLVIAGVVIALVVFCCICTGVLLVLVNREQASYAPLAAACDGQAVPSAAAYVRGAPPKLTYFVRIASWSASQSLVPASQRATGVADTALVVCATDETHRQVVETCCYERTVIGVGVPGSERCLPRVRLHTTVSVRVARTGALLTQREVFGPEPPACDDWAGREPNEGDFVGDEPDANELAPFLADPEAPDTTPGPVTPPGTTGTPTPTPPAPATTPVK